MLEVWFIVVTESHDPIDNFTDNDNWLYLACQTATDCPLTDNRFHSLSQGWIQNRKVCFKYRLFNCAVSTLRLIQFKLRYEDYEKIWKEACINVLSWQWFRMTGEKKLSQSWQRQNPVHKYKPDMYYHNS